MTEASTSPQHAQIAARIRQRLVTEATNAMELLVGVVMERLTSLLDEAVPSREMQVRRDTWTVYQKQKNLWRDGTLRTWQAALKPVGMRSSLTTPLSLGSALELVGTEVVENRIVASRLALGVMEKAASEVNDLRKRIKSLNNNQELIAQDIVHPESLAQPIVEQWVSCGLPRESWVLVNDVVQQHLNVQFKQMYARCNEDLIKQGILPVIEFASRPNPNASARSVGPASRPAPSTRSTPLAAEEQTAPPHRSQPDVSSVRPYDAGVVNQDGDDTYRHNGEAPSTGGMLQSTRRRNAGIKGIFDRVTRLLTHVSAAPASLSAQDGQKVAHVHRAPSENLMIALARQPRLVNEYFDQPWVIGGLGDSGVSGSAGAASVEGTAGPIVIEQMVSDLRQQSTELKEKAQTDNEKAIIELVALMFQAILQEDRIPTGIRVWFARLQMPVLRVALADPDFFNKLDHPARQLIDHMGSCVMGFDASGIDSKDLETEIKRVVQVVEQYPDTGDRVYKRVYEEFLAFLKKHLTKKDKTQKVVGVAQQLEQKETLTIQYTIELRNLLKDMPVRDEIREFLFRVWAEVLAVSAVRYGSQHEETMLIKKTASDLIWAASAKPNRADRARVIADLPDLLQCLRQGMGLLGLVRAAQEAHIKIISDILADAFMSKTQSIGAEQIQNLAARLAHLEDYIGDDGAEELPIDTHSIEELLGIDASDLDVISSGTDNASVSPVMREWASTLDLGAWFKLDHNGSSAQVQYVWRSPLGHLHLFATSLGRSYLIQTLRLAAYLQAGLLEPQEEESLTVRATRTALGKIEANPERLLG